MPFPSARGGRLLAALGVAGALGLAACSSSPSNSSGAGTTTTTHRSTNSTVPDGGALVAIAGTWGTPPTVTVPSGTPPTSLSSADLITGTGPAVAQGDTVTVEYVLATYSSGKVVQSSWTSSPFTFTVGLGDVIPGWDKGVIGMKQGGRRELIIPPQYGSGAESPGPGIASNDTLVFVIDMEKVQSQ
jgi:peptidylprolyl isomerase